MIPIKTSTIKNPLGMPSKLNIDPCQFDTNFKLIIATTPDEKERAFLLRHHVFNEELNYNIGDKTSSTVEKDSHDTHSLLCLLQHRESGMDVGCLRVVFIDEAMNSFSKKLPFEEYCKNSLTNPKLHPKNLPQDTICEVSRLAVHPLFRKKKSTIESNICNTENTHQKNESLNQSIISLSLFLAATALVGLAQRRHVFAMLEPRFNRLLKASGLHFQQVGEIINHCGFRAAYYIDQHKAVKNLPSQLIPFYAYIEKELTMQINTEN